MSDAQIIAGQTAKKQGHLNEERICKWLNENHEGTFVVDGKPNTKVDIININTNTAYSLKSVSKNHTQCHLTSSSRWCEYFNIDGKLKSWFMQFFGVPGIDVSEGKSRRHRLTQSEIEFELNDLAYQWFNNMKQQVFDVILASGMNQTPVDYLIWHQKKTKQTDIISIDFFRSMIGDGEWIMKETTLHFIANENKFFHLQMKGSGKKYTSGYHGLMFHIHRNGW
jgi:effector-binding domain-containing protein